MNDINLKLNKNLEKACYLANMLYMKKNNIQNDKNIIEDNILIEKLKKLT
jgi:hypothetical protein